MKITDMFARVMKGIGDYHYCKGVVERLNDYELTIVFQMILEKLRSQKRTPRYVNYKKYQREKNPPKRRIKNV